MAAGLLPIQTNFPEPLMTAKNLSTVANNVIESYGNTAKNVINAYRVGGERVVGLMDQRWESAVEKAGSRLSTEIRGNALAAQKTISGYCTKGITLTTDGADVVVGKVVELAEKGVTQAAVNASRFEKATGSKALNTLALAAVPAAEAVSKVVVKLEQKSSLLAGKVAGKTVKAKATAKVVKAKATARAVKAKVSSQAVKAKAAAVEAVEAAEAA